MSPNKIGLPGDQSFSVGKRSRLVQETKIHSVRFPAVKVLQVDL